MSFGKYLKEGFDKDSEKDVYYCNACTTPDASKEDCCEFRIPKGFDMPKIDCDCGEVNWFKL